MSKQEYAQNYVVPEQQRMALHLLPDEIHPKEEWDGIWQRILNSPAL
jgi:hypothetical protein